MTNALTQAIETLLSADGAALQELDAKISALQQQIEQLRRVRKLIAPIAPKGKPAAGNAGIIDGVPQGGRMSEVVDLVIDALETGPVHYRELSNLLDVDVRLLCRSIHRSERLHRDADGMVSLVDALALREVY